MRAKTVKLIGLLLGMLMMGLGTGLAEPEPDGPPDERLLRKLIAEEAKVLEKTINVAVILPGKLTTTDGFQTEHAARVIYLWSTKVDGMLARVIEEKTFYWNEDYGWFTYVRSESRGLPVVDIFSETKGPIRLR